MRNLFQYRAGWLLLLVMLTTSCGKKFLEIVPKGQLVATTFDDYNQLMNNTGFYYYQAGLWQPAMLMGDEMSAEATSYNSTSSGFVQGRLFFQWEADIFLHSTQVGSTSDNPGFLTQSLKMIYLANSIVNGVDGATTGTDVQKQDLKAQALASRAFIQFQLINYFGKPYSAATAASDPGFPVITTADAARTDFERGTVQQSYDAIVNDLTTAIPLLNVQPVFQTRMSKPAAEALLGKVYLFMSKYDDALKMFNAAFDDMSKMTHPPRLYDYNQEFAADGSFLPVNPTSGPASPFNNITDLTESLVAIMGYQGLNNYNGYPNDFLTISPQTVGLYQPSDWRLQFYTDLQPDMDPIPVAAGPNAARRLRKYGVSYVRIGIELPELYLLRAEAEARTGNLTDAVTDVEALRTKRIPAQDATVPASAGANQTALVKFIIDERIREFAGEGYRWFDMRRLSADPLFSGQTMPTHVLYDVDGTVSKTFTLTANRLTLRFPPPYLSSHPDMVDNP